MRVKERDLTKWFPPSIKPVRKGVYNASLYKNAKIFRHWDGKEWTAAEYKIERAANSRDVSPFTNQIYWRGLNKEPK